MILLIVGDGMHKVFISLKKIFNKMDKPLLFVTIFVFLFGLFNIVTASSREAINNDVDLYYYFYRHIIMLGIGLFFSIFLIIIDTNKYKKWIPLFFLVIAGILIACIFVALIYYSYINGYTGVMITASHNPYTDNGIKVLNKGYKLSENEELLIKSLMSRNFGKLV